MSALRGDISDAIVGNIVYEDGEPTDLMTRVSRDFDAREFGDIAAGDALGEVIEAIKNADTDDEFGKSAAARKAVAAVIKFLES